MSNVYQSATEEWIFFDGTSKHFFDTEQEAVQMASKQEYAKALQRVATKLAEVADEFADIVTVYHDRGYGGGNAITDGDLAGLGITAADVGGGITVGEQLTKFLNNLEVTTGDYDVNLNKLRTDV
jgi:hypothetical protein